MNFTVIRKSPFNLKFSRFGFGNSLTNMSSSFETYLNPKSQMSKKHFNPPAERNKEPILQTLMKYIDKSKNGYLLEISSGSGQHVSHIAPNFPNIIFQPTELHKESLKSIDSYASECHSGNIKESQFLDVRDHPSAWLGGSLKPESLDYILNVNMMHISEWACSEGLFKGSGMLLKKDGILFTYGPYSFNRSITPKSNVSFDVDLRSRNPSWGLRDVVLELEPLAKANGIILENKYDLPANNNLLVWIKK